MRKIIVFTFSTMDGVLQSPGGPQEDPSNGFKWGGWTFHYWDDMMNETMDKLTANPYDLLLGRRTYEIFAAHWPYQENHPIAEIFNRIEKYVVATTPVDLSWKKSTLISGDVVSELKKLKSQNGPDLLVHGSSRLVQILLSNQLVDILDIWTFPITFGKGKKLFQEGTGAHQWKLTQSAISKTGVIMASYIPDGDVKIGSFVPDQVSDAELLRRDKLAKEKQ